MDYIRIFTIITMIYCISFTGTSFARESKSVLYDWPETHWENLDFMPHVERYPHTHRPMGQQAPFQYSDDETSRGIIATFRTYNLLNKYYIDEETGLSIAEIGPYFYDLSQSDKIKFVATLDRIYNITTSDQTILFLHDWNTKKSIGQYTNSGLMLF